MSKIYNVRITSGTAPGPYTIYYNSINPSTIALLTGSETPATGLTISQMTTGVGIIIPDSSTSIILYNVDCENNITYLISNTPTPTPTPTLTPTPVGFTIYISGFNSSCNVYCQNNINFTILTTSTSGYNDIGIGDVINGITTGGFYAIGSNSGSTSNDPFKVVETDFNGVVLSVNICVGSQCEPL